MLDIAAVFLAATALFAWLNRRFMRLPTTIGVMAIALLMSLAIVVLDRLGLHWPRDYETGLLHSIDFYAVLMEGMLSFLLFAAALHIDLNELRVWRRPVFMLALFGTTLSAVLIGLALYYLLPLFGSSLPLVFCLIFGALISPTDPVAVMGPLKSAHAPKSVELVIAGEALFNDSVGVVLFVLATSMLSSSHLPGGGEVLSLFLREAVGGLAFGWVLGRVAVFLLSRIDRYQEVVLITLATVMGGYALADRLDVSGPLAMVVSGLIIGARARSEAMSDTTRRYVDMFWELLDAILNSALFVLIGLEIAVLDFSGALVVPALAAALVVLAARWFTVAAPVLLSRSSFGLPAGAWQVLTWGGLRGGVSVALALSLPPGPYRDVVVAITYAIVVTSILVQGLTIGPLVRRTFGSGPA